MLFNDTAWRDLATVAALVPFSTNPFFSFFFFYITQKKWKERRECLTVGSVFDRNVVDLQVAELSFAFGDQIPSGASQRI